MLPTDSIDRVYRRRIPGRIAMAASTVIAVKRKTQLLWRNLIIGRPEDVGQLGDYRDRGFFLRLSHVYFRPSLEGIDIFSASYPGEARPKLPPGRVMTEAKVSEDYQQVR